VAARSLEKSRAQTVMGQIEAHPGPARRLSVFRGIAGPPEQPGPTDGHGGEGDSDSSESPEGGLDFTDVVKKSGGDDVSGSLLRSEKADGVARHPDGMAPIRTGHASPEQLFAVEQVVDSPGLIRGRRTTRQESLEEAPGEVAP